MLKGLQRIQAWLRGDDVTRPETVHLILGMALVGTLTYAKMTMPPPSKPAVRLHLTSDHLFHNRGKRLQLPSRIIKTSDAKVAITEGPITNQQYREFVLRTQYRTERERQKLSPSWRESAASTEPSWVTAPDAPVEWVSRRDAEAFCLWMAREAGTDSPYDRRGNTDIVHRKGFRLPTVEELTTASVDTERWLWTCCTLADNDTTRSNANEYKTAFRAGDTLRHRQDNEVFTRDHEPTAFYVAWTVELATESR